MTSDLRDTVRDLYAALEALNAGRPEGDAWNDRVNVSTLRADGARGAILADCDKPSGFVRLRVGPHEPVWLSPGAVAILREGLGEMPDPSVRLDSADHARLTAEVARLQGRETELQNDASRHEREARIARARAEYWEAEADVRKTARDWAETAPVSHYRVLDQEQHHGALLRREQAKVALDSYGVDPQGRPRP